MNVSEAYISTLEDRISTKIVDIKYSCKEMLTQNIQSEIDQISTFIRSDQRDWKKAKLLDTLLRKIEQHPTNTIYY